MMYKSYLEKHNKVFFSLLLSQSKLYQRCAEVENQARDMYNMLVETTNKAEGVTENLKEQDQWEWVLRMGNIQQQASEVVSNEIIFK